MFYLNKVEFFLMADSKVRRNTETTVENKVIYHTSGPTQ